MPRAEVAARLLSVWSMNHGVLIAIVLAGCFEPEEPPGAVLTSSVTRREVPVLTNRKLDVLFVIDNSPGIAPHRDNVLASLRELAEKLQKFPGGLPDLHVGVVTTDVGTRGALDVDPGPSIGSGDGACTSDGEGGELHANGAAVTGTFLYEGKRFDGTRVRNYGGTLASALVAMADRGSRGCALPRPLEAVRRALQHPSSDGFVREDAFLAVVFITPSNDCSIARAGSLEGTLRCPVGSLVPVEAYAQLLKALKPDPSKVIVSGVLGPRGPEIADTSRSRQASCVADGGPAGSGRLHELLDQFPNRSSWASICERDYAAAFAFSTPLHTITLGVPCFDAPLADADLATPGTQYDCAVWYEQRGYGVDVLASCDARDRPPCYRIERDVQLCPIGSSELLELDLGTSFPDEARIIAECVTR